MLTGGGPAKSPDEAGADVVTLPSPLTGAASGRLVAVQVKTRYTGSYTGETELGFKYLMDETDVAYWKGCNLPVIIVLVHLERNQAYWKSVDTGESPSGRQLRIDKTKDLFDAGACDAIAGLCVAKSGFGMWLQPLKTGETGHLNLLDVMLQESIYVTASPFTHGRPALHELLIHEERPPDDWIIRGGSSCRSAIPVKALSCSVEPIASEEIVFPDDEAEEGNMIELRRRTLGAQLDRGYQAPGKRASRRRDPCTTRTTSMPSGMRRYRIR
jgi:hypothetical protein